MEILDDLRLGEYEVKLNHRRLLDAMLDIAGVPPQVGPQSLPGTPGQMRPPGGGSPSCGCRTLGAARCGQRRRGPLCRDAALNAQPSVQPAAASV